jgi:hypothetical protein
MINNEQVSLAAADLNKCPKPIKMDHYMQRVNNESHFFSFPLSSVSIAEAPKLQTVNHNTPYIYIL